MRGPFAPAFLCLWLCIFSSAASASEREQSLPLDLLQAVLWGEPECQPEEVSLEADIPAFTVVLVQTQWFDKHPRQADNPEHRRYCMKLPEPERLKYMIRIDDHIQVWWIPEDVYKTIPNPGRLSSQIPLNEQTHRYHREMAFAGIGHGYAWFVHAPISEWIYLQEQLHLLGGDDSLAAAIRGTTVEDQRSQTRKGCLAVIGNAGPAVIPYVNHAIQTKLETRQVIIANLNGAMAPAVTDYLIELAASVDPEVVAGACTSLIRHPCAEAASLYERWLREDAGRSDVENLLTACRQVRLASLADLLQRVLESPSHYWEYMLAFKIQRELSDTGIPSQLERDAELIGRLNYPRDGRSDSDEISQAVHRIISSRDHEAAAVIALSLALQVTKGGTGEANRAGIKILRGLPEGTWKQLLQRVSHTTWDFELERIRQIAAEVEQGSPEGALK